MKRISKAKRAANRRNAQQSTGPKTPEGKAASARNAVRHGLSSGDINVLPTEKQETLDALIRELNEQNEPKSAAEKFHIEQMIHARWNLLRVRRLEAEALDAMIENSGGENIDRGILSEIEKPGNVLDKLARYAAAAGRAYSRAVRDLAQLRANAKKAEQQNKANEARIWLAEELAKVKRKPLPACLFDEPAPVLQNEAKPAPLTMAARL
jgi:hypothetical protein